MVLQFTAEKEGVLFRYEYNGQTAAVCTFDGAKLEFALLYDVREQPLKLTAEAAAGDAVRIVLLPYRIELYVNELLLDEEWPYGEHFLEEAQIAEGKAPETAPYEAPEIREPSVLGAFTDAEHWYPAPGVNIGDCMPYTDGGRYHVLYLKDRHHHGSKWGLGAHQWEHISTDDFVNWQIHPTAVAIDSPEEGSICTGSYIHSGGRHQLYYSIRSVDGSPAYIRRSVSDDGYHFEKDRDFGFVLPKPFNQASVRDPKVFRGDDGLFHMFVTTSLADRGALAHLTSADLENWETLEEPVFVSPDSAEPECSDFFTFGDYDYLIFSLYARGQYRISEKGKMDWREPEDPRIPSESVPKCAVFRDRIIFTGFINPNAYAGSFVFTEAFADENGILSFRRIHA